MINEFNVFGLGWCFVCLWIFSGFGMGVVIVIYVLFNWIYVVLECGRMVLFGGYESVGYIFYILCEGNRNTFFFWCI